jgi:hypothetical protein
MSWWAFSFSRSLQKAGLQWDKQLLLWYERSTGTPCGRWLLQSAAATTTTVALRLDSWSMSFWNPFFAAAAISFLFCVLGSLWVAKISSTAAAAAIILQPNSLQILLLNYWSSENTISLTWFLLHLEYWNCYIHWVIRIRSFLHVERIISPLVIIQLHPFTYNHFSFLEILY